MLLVTSCWLLVVHGLALEVNNCEPRAIDNPFSYPLKDE